MERWAVAGLVLCGLLAGYLLGASRGSDDAGGGGRPTAAATLEPSPGSTEAARPRRIRPILRWFLDADEDRLPVQGTLGGTTEVTHLGFPASFDASHGAIFYAVMSDGHFEITYRYRMDDTGRWLALDRRQGARLEAWGPPREEVYVWKRVPESFVPLD